LRALGYLEPMPKADTNQPIKRRPRTKLNSQVNAQDSIWVGEATPPFAIGETAKILHNNLKYYIALKYNSFEKFAHAVRIPKSTLSQVLNYRRDPKLATLEQLARALGVTVPCLLTKPDPIPETWGNE